MAKPYGKSSASGWWIVGGIIVVIIILFSIGKFGGGASAPTAIADPTTLPGIQTSPAPWQAEITNLHARLTDIGLPALAAEGTVLHIHQHLDIYIDGQLTQIPAGTGIDEADGFISPIHVHDNTDVIHVESPVDQPFYLGQFFDIWGVRFTANCIGSYCAQGDKSLKVFVNGTQYTSDPRQLALDAHQEIVIAYGTDKELPNPIPATYSFPEGE